MDRLIAILAFGILISACQNTTSVAEASPSPTPTPHATPTDVVLQAPDVPAGLNPCLGSGPMDVYITTLAHADAGLAARIAAQWQQLQEAGATAAAISLFTSTPAACNAELATTSSAKSAVAFVAVFGDPGQADRAWNAGVFGFAPPAPGELPAGVASGTATGLGLSSWTYNRPPVQLASWQKSVFVALVVVCNLPAATFKAATGTIDARLN
ncbi:MAG: hypothetical protein ACYDAL_00010 [Candidatus Dormibacteraceae bacterium]